MKLETGLNQSCFIIAGVNIKSNVVLPEGTRLVSTKHDDGFSDDVDVDKNEFDENEFGTSAFAYVSDEEEEVDSDASVDGPLEAEDPWGQSLQVCFHLKGTFINVIIVL